MCGIAGILNLNGAPVDREGLITFTRSLAHRGPDAEGYWNDPGFPSLAVGHRRLAIVDLGPGGAQPMLSRSGRSTIVFNGEIYNYVELRKELTALGHTFVSDSDTEVILAAYEQWGEGCQERFNGMWAFAIWDRRERSLFLSRDRFGIKPLLYHWNGTTLSFASELKAFLSLPGYVPQEDEEAMQAALVDVMSVERSSRTLLRGVSRVPAGHALRVGKGVFRVQRWWNTLDHLPQTPRRFEDQAAEFRHIFLDACRLRLRTDVPVATSLSGGVDSTAVASALAHLGRQGGAGPQVGARDWRQAFVATFPGSSNDERRFAEIAVEHCNLHGEYLDMSTVDVEPNLKAVAFASDDIYNTSLLPLWAIYGAMRARGSTVSLDGHGADELLAGYPHHGMAALRASKGLLAPRRTADLMGTLRGMYASGAPRRRALLAQSDPLLGGLRRLVRGRGAPSGPPLGRGSTQLSAAFMPRQDAGVKELPPLTQALYFDFHQGTLPTILRNFDRMSMAHGVEVRMPFMDWRLVCFSFALPDESKFGHGYAKRVLRHAMAGIMPEAIRTRRDKVGFNAPTKDWFAGSLGAWLWNKVNDPHFLESAAWDGPGVREFVQQRRSSGNWTWADGERVWHILSAQLWRETFLTR